MRTNCAGPVKIENFSKKGWKENIYLHVYKHPTLVPCENKCISQDLLEISFDT